MSNPSPGWLERQTKAVHEEVAAWPAWMRQAAGIEESNSQGGDRDEGSIDTDLYEVAVNVSAADEPEERPA